MPISIGAVMGGPEALPCTKIFRDMMKSFSGNSETPCLNVVFHFPGSLISPPYAGMRTAKFSKAEKIQMVQVAVPAEIAQSSNSQELLQFFESALIDAISLSRQKWEKNKIAYPYDADTSLVKDKIAGVDRASDT